jgi:hypothetical protein
MGAMRLDPRSATITLVSVWLALSALSVAVWWTRRRYQGLDDLRWPARRRQFTSTWSTEVTDLLPRRSARGEGWGLISMRERLNLVDGEIHVESRPGAGTTVRVRVPLAYSDQHMPLA